MKGRCYWFLKTHICSSFKYYIEKVILDNEVTFSKLKDRIELPNSWGMYSIYCQCGPSYIGQTKRGLELRIKEHKQYNAKTRN